MSWRTHYGQAFATLWGVQSQSAAISCQASRAVEGQAPQHKASDHPTNLEEPRRALSVTTDRIFARQKDVPEKQKKKRSSTKPLITLVRCVKNKRSFLRHLDFLGRPTLLQRCFNVVGHKDASAAISRGQQIVLKQKGTFIFHTQRLSDRHRQRRPRLNSINNIERVRPWGGSAETFSAPAEERLFFTHRGWREAHTIFYNRFEKF